MSTFVSVGNGKRPFSRLLMRIEQLAINLPPPVVVQHGHTPFASTNCVAMPFIDMDTFPLYMQRANVLIVHAGAGAIIHAVKAGKIPVVMPRRAVYGEIVDDHQLEFARALAKSGKVVLAEEPDDLGSAIAEALARQETMQRVSQHPQILDMVRNVLNDCSKKLGA